MHMTVTLNQLSDNELQIYNEAGYHQRDTGVRITDNSDKWLFKDYKSIHKEYLNLFERSNDDMVKIEALKRLIYLNLEFFVEDSFYTGIKELDDVSIYNSYKILNDYINENKLDEEFKWMLSAYSCWDFVILRYSENKFNELTSFVRGVDTSILHSPKNSLSNGMMDNRGQMGIYWKPIVEKGEF
jgi:hypothetical protein